ncbi:MAG: 3-deoxy-8-phosphooctulonate synthase [Bdellovibrionales bacterium GWA2_49_15]|nr:MAG: 3-deoxy-8-phosphooctulonate synthase [Bdellovibrionales bacterium GWA2_49_15]HAZ14369.1 3-deoxy-8-phosphooctulonate synthase [Bdellovibrionales bacterium]
MKPSPKPPLLLFLGPCVLESESLALEIAHQIKEDLQPLGEKIQLFYKGSFDKANRTSFDAYRGPGMEKGLAILELVKKRFNLPVITDIHLPEQAETVASVVDVLQIPAFLCRQTDLICTAALAAKKYNRMLKVKKGQFLSPEEAGNIVKKAEHYLPKDKILLTERGSSFGYNNLVVDMSSFKIMQSFGVRAIYDATHSVQRPGGLGTATGGKREHVEVLARAAVAAGADGVFIETHPTPEKALSDASTALPLSSIKTLVEKLVTIYQVI